MGRIPIQFYWNFSRGVTADLLTKEGYQSLPWILKTNKKFKDEIIKILRPESAFAVPDLSCHLSCQGETEVGTANVPSSDRSTPSRTQELPGSVRLGKGAETAPEILLARNQGDLRWRHLGRGLLHTQDPPEDRPGG